MGGRDRKVLGAAVMVAAVLGLLIVNHVSGRDVPGTATAKPLIPPPPAGSCLLEAGTDVTVVPCADQHTSEVADSRQAFSGGAPLWCGLSRTEPPTRTIATVGWGYWAFPLEKRRIAFGGSVGWQACVTGLTPPSVRTDSAAAGYRGRVADLADPAKRPVELRLCFDSAVDIEPAPPGVSCLLKHRGEVLGIAWVSNPTDAAMAASCRALATALIGSDRPVATGELLARTGTQPLVPGTESGGNTAFVTCGVQARAGSQLVGSVIGLGNGPIPYG